MQELLYQNLNDKNELKVESPNLNSFNNSNNNNNNYNNNNNKILKILKIIYYKLKYYFKSFKIFLKNNLKLILKRIFGQLCFLALIFGIITPISIYIYNNSPSKYLSSELLFSPENSTYSPILQNISIYDQQYFPNQWDDVNVLLDTHSHTYYSDGSLSPEENIKWHILNGYNVMFMTDHNQVYGGLVGMKIAQEKYSDKILVIPGIEWTNCRCHLNLIGITENVPLIKYPTDEEIKNLIDLVHSKGGLVILNHYPWSSWSGLDQPSIQQWYDWGIDFLEVANQYTFDYQGMIFCKNHNLRYVSGSDFHYYQRAYAWTVFNIPELGNTGKIPTQEMVMSTLLNTSTKTSFAFDPVASNTIMVEFQFTKFNPTWIFLSPWIYLGGFFHSFFELKKGMYSFVDGSCTGQTLDIHSKEISCLIFWIFLIFFLIHFLNILILILKNFLLNLFKKIKNFLKLNNKIKTPKFKSKNFNLDNSEELVSTNEINNFKISEDF
ncbi:hypothetical protein DDB_G0288779 [Dictyostelium discoideum AX4]|uniref:Polymerase/histidinol phosphatase N-terminal domain-containing protein n=1 Tax=Dictyostelium discoideum TaxID=44689 RepID=Q54IG4_DICDI|nr:hypothetical protein DDB_G0288779 [Dictyostelium discoideum AX4]EAL63011.1 hypothetical protein DDB_G0288779 [Dictyostelium discoideum AX4]|eukprot:XP_636513.1 hypothetical protein DDB_G0288779 [Dictyostelium discoideum AX4]